MIHFNSKQTFVPSSIIVEEEIQNSAMARRILLKYPDAEKRVVPDAAAVLDQAATSVDKDV